MTVHLACECARDKGRELAGDNTAHRADARCGRPGRLGGVGMHTQSNVGASFYHPNPDSGCTHLAVSEGAIARVAARDVVTLARIAAGEARPS